MLASVSLSSSPTKFLCGLSPSSSLQLSPFGFVSHDDLSDWYRLFSISSESASETCSRPSKTVPVLTTRVRPCLDPGCNVVPWPQFESPCRLDLFWRRFNNLLASEMLYQSTSSSPSSKCEWMDDVDEDAYDSLRPLLLLVLQHSIGLPLQSKISANIWHGAG